AAGHTADRDRHRRRLRACLAQPAAGGAGRSWRGRSRRGRSRRGRPRRGGILAAPCHPLAHRNAAVAAGGAGGGLHPRSPAPAGGLSVVDRNDRSGREHTSDDSTAPSTVAVLQHPIHPMLVIYPIGFLTTSLATDLAYWHTGTAFWALCSFWLVLGGFGVALL